MITRKIGYRTYLRNPDFWIDQQMKGVTIELTRNGGVYGTLYGEPEIYGETRQEKLRRNKITVYPRRKDA